MENHLLVFSAGECVTTSLRLWLEGYVAKSMNKMEKADITRSL